MIRRCLIRPFGKRTPAILEEFWGVTSLAARPIPGNGRFRTVWRCLDGTFVTYRHSWSTGMGYLMNAGSYFGQFKQPLPAWALRMPPFVCSRLCGLALIADQPLTEECPQADNGELVFARFAKATEGAKLLRAD